MRVELPIEITQSRVVMSYFRTNMETPLIQARQKNDLFTSVLDTYFLLKLTIFIDVIIC